MNKFYYSWINYKVNLSILESLKFFNVAHNLKRYSIFNENEWWSDHYRGFFSRGFILRDSSITYKVVENWLEYQDGKSPTIMSELKLTEGTYYND